MTLDVTVLLLAVSIIGIVLAWKFLREKRTLRIVFIVLFSLLALACVAYIGLTFIFLYGIQTQPPAL